jgi:hypothetical protein
LFLFQGEEKDGCDSDFAGLVPNKNKIPYLINKKKVAYIYLVYPCCKMKKAHLEITQDLSAVL